MLLLVTGRISDHNIQSYNEILSEYIDLLVNTKQADKDPKSVDQVIFYISFLIGEDFQSASYVKYLLNVEDSTVLQRIQQVNSDYFSQTLTHKFNVALAESGIYRSTEGRRDYFLQQEIIEKVQEQANFLVKSFPED